jgi:Ala-tRNA(Pro) deacylase
MPKTPEELLEMLGHAGYAVRTTRHPPLFTVEDSRRLRGDIEGRHTKNLFLKDRKDNYFLVTVGEDREVDLKEIHRVIGAAGRVSFGRPERLMEFLGVSPGAVTALAVINDTAGRVRAVFDRELMDHGLINAHPLTNEATTTLRRDDLLAFMASTGHPPAILDVAR